MSSAVHWRKRLKNGDIQFHVKTGKNGVSGTVDSEAVADHIVKCHEAVYKVAVPAPEWRT